MTYLSPNNPTRSIPSGRGFTLAEVMFAVLILGIGLISIASLFPAAGAIQKNTMTDVTGDFVASNIEAKLKARGISESQLTTYIPDVAANHSVVKNLTDMQLDNIGLTIGERVFPEAYDANRNDTPNEDATEDNTFEKRQFYWRPLFMRDAQGNWKIYVFVQRRIGDAVPTVVNSGNANAGDWTVQGNGTLSRMTDDVSNNHWKGAIVGNSSTTVTVVTLSNGVIR